MSNPGERIQTTSPSQRPTETYILPLPYALGEKQRDFAFYVAGHEITKIENSGKESL